MQSAALLERRRDIRVMSVVGVCHFFSHFYQFSLPPLFLLINRYEGYSFESLGLLITIFFATSFALQIPVGFIVDRFGARALLMGGVGVMATATVLYGVFPSYGAMMAFAVIAGAGNSVFHPADYSILAASVTRARLGRAFSVHNLGGFVGYALAPFLMAAIGEAYGWRTALIAGGTAGLIVMLASIALSGDFRDSSHARRDVEKHNTLRQDLGMLLAPAPLLCVLFFALLAAGQLGVQFFADKVFNAAHGVPLLLGNSFTSSFVIGAIVGIVVGGLAADRGGNPLRLTVLSFLTASGIILLLGVAPPNTALLFALMSSAGFFFGFGFASRDLVVSGIAPPEASGKVFGFVFSGLDIGSAIVPAMFGRMLDDGRPLLVFFVGGTLMGLSAICVYFAGRSAGRRASPAE